MLEGRPASNDASPSMSHAQSAAHSAEADHMMDTAAPLLNAVAPATQQPAQLQHAEQTPNLLDTSETQAPATAISHDTHPDRHTSHQLDPSGKGQQQQQSVPGVTHHTGTDAADPTEAGMHIQQEVAGVAKGATLSQESSSMMSLSPSLKLDIPGLDFMLDSHMLSEHEDQAMSQPLVQPSLHQQQHHIADHQHQHQQQPVEEHQQQQQKGDSPFMEDMPASAAETQAASMPSAGPSSPAAHQSSPRSMPSASLPHSDQQAAEEAVSPSLISAVPQQHTSPQHAKPSLDQSGTKGAQAAGALLLSAAADSSGHDVPTASQGPQPSNTGCASKLAVDDRSPAGPTDDGLSKEHQAGSSDISKALQPVHDSMQSKPGNRPPGEIRPSAMSGAKSAETVAPDSTVLTDSKPGANRSSNARPEASTHAKEPHHTGSAAQGTAMRQAHGAVPAPSQAVDAAAVEQLPDALTVPMQQGEAADVSQQVAEPGEDVTTSQEGLHTHTSQHTSVTALKKVCHLLDT